MACIVLILGNDANSRLLSGFADESALEVHLTDDIRTYFGVILGGCPGCTKTHTVDFTAGPPNESTIRVLQEIFVLSFSPGGTRTAGLNARAWLASRGNGTDWLAGSIGKTIYLIDE